MQLFIIAALLGFIFFVIQAIQKKQPSTGAPKTETIEELPNADTPLPIAGAYQKKWLLTYNEKDVLTSVSRMQRPKKRTTGSSLVGLNSRHMKKVLSMTRP